MCTVSVEIQKKLTEDSVDSAVSPELLVNLASVTLAPCCTTPLPYPERRTLAWPIASVGGVVAYLRRRLPRRQSHPWRPTGGTLQHNAVWHCPSRLGPPRGLLHRQRTPAAPSLWPGTHRARSLPPTGRTTVPLGTGHYRPYLAELGTEMGSVHLLVDAQAPKPTVQPQRRRNRPPDLSRSRQPPRAGYI